MEIEKKYEEVEIKIGAKIQLFGNLATDKPLYVIDVYKSELSEKTFVKLNNKFNDNERNFLLENIQKEGYEIIN